MGFKVITERMLQIAGVDKSGATISGSGPERLAKLLNLEYIVVGDTTEIYTETDRVAWVAVDRASGAAQVSEYDSNGKIVKTYKINDINELGFRLRGILNGKRFD